MESTIDRMKYLVDQLNKYRNAYYNENVSLVSDKQYDDLFDELQNLENTIGTVFANSPTHTVGYDVVSTLNKVKHNHPMLSLGKTKDVDDVVKFLHNHDGVIMAKMDGLTCSLKYMNGELVSAETRGNGEIGEDILHCAKVISNLPLKIKYKGELIIDGEVIITYDDFERVNDALPIGQKYKNPRNLASGSLRQLDSKIAADRNIKFIAWKLITGNDSNSFFKNWSFMAELGFDVVPMINLPKEMVSIEFIANAIELIKCICKNESFPIDGCVFGYDDIAYGESLGMTDHHPKSQLAFKFYDDTYETILRDIEWNTTRTGMVVPIAVFDPIDLDGAITSRASLSNVSIIKELLLGIGDTITVSRRNAVIPHLEENLSKSNTYKLPEVCPCCGSKLSLNNDGTAEVLYCTNTSCASRILAKFTHFVCKSGLNIDGLFDATLEKLLGLGILTDYESIFKLKNHKAEICSLDGFGEKSFNKLINAIAAASNVKMENLLVALGIDQIGTRAAKTIAKYFNGDWSKFVHALDTNFSFTSLEDFGPKANAALYSWYHGDHSIEGNLFNFITVLPYENKEPDHNNFMSGKTFVVTGKFESMSRSEIESIIIANGGKLASAVSNKTDYLLTNDANSGSSKAKKANELGIKIMSEEEFLKIK